MSLVNQVTRVEKLSSASRTETELLKAKRQLRADTDDMKHAINFQTYAAPLVVGVLLAEQELDRHLHPPVQKLEKEITIVNRFGLHMRPAAVFAQTAERFHSEIRVAKVEARPMVRVS